MSTDEREATSHAQKPEAMDAVRERPRWPFALLWLAVPVMLFLQVPHVLCACDLSKYKTELALVFDAFVVVRLLLAHMRTERGHGWIFYLALMLSSPWWIEYIVTRAAGR